MSTLKVTNIQSNGAGFNDVVSFQNSGGTENGTLCRAWINFNGSGTVAIRANFNVSSIADRGVGRYTINFANAMADSNYVTLCTVEDSQTSTPFMKIDSSTYNTTQLFVSVGGNGGSADPTICCLAVFR